MPNSLTPALAQPGTLIRARGREWVVLPESSPELLLARPLGGLDEEITGILPVVEPVESAAFSLPAPADVGDFHSGRLLREAARLSTRAAAGPFRSFARIAVEPRPYQLVPLMMALKLDPVRLLIADDVGIGKTIEAALIARELLDRGEIRRLAVLCPPHLAEQWQQELAEKFHIEAERVLSSTIQRLERHLPVGVSVFDRHRVVGWYPPISSRASAAPPILRSSAPSSSSWTKPTAVPWPGAWAGAGNSALIWCARSPATRSAMWCWSPPRRTAATKARSVCCWACWTRRFSSCPTLWVVDSAADEEIDAVGQQTVLDLNAEDEDVSLDFSPGAATERDADATRRALRAFAQRAEALAGAADAKLQGAIPLVKALLAAEFRPIVFCRFVDTADYVARHLRAALPKARIEAVTGLLPPAEREARIQALMQGGGPYLLVCTDCLSEGVNLQQAFNAVLHYDLCWNPTRHEQREGRVDRFGQRQPEVRVITYYGQDNPIDGVILDVLIRKHKSIKSDLGVTVAVPGSSEQVARTLFEGALFRSAGGGAQQLRLDLGQIQPKIRAFHQDWENARDREKASRSRYAQQTLAPEAVAAELQSVRAAIGGGEDVARFVRTVAQAAHLPMTGQPGGALTFHLSPETPRALRQALGRDEPFTGRFDLPLGEGEVYLGRTSPIVEGLAGWALDQALDPAARDPNAPRPVAARCGVIMTSAVAARTTLLLARFRFHLRTAGKEGETLLCEEIVPLAATGPADNPQWLTGADGERMLAATPEGNPGPTRIDQQLTLLASAMPGWQAALEPVAQTRASAQREAHERVREAARAAGRVTIEPVLPVDVLGAYVLLPVLGR